MAAADLQQCAGSGSGSWVHYLVPEGMSKTGYPGSPAEHCAPRVYLIY